MDKMGPRSGEERGRDPMTKAVMPYEEWQSSDEGIKGELTVVGIFVGAVIVAGTLGYTISEVVKQYLLTR